MRKGFTLLELLTVVIIVAILAAVAVPQFFKVAERARAAEGVNVLGGLRSSQLRYYAEHGILADDPDDLDFDVRGLKFFAAPAIPGGASASGYYTGGVEVVGTITRTLANNAGFGAYILRIQSDGDITCTGGTKCPSGF